MVSQSELSKKQTIDTSVQLRPLVDDCGSFGMFDKSPTHTQSETDIYGDLPDLIELPQLSPDEEEVNTNILEDVKQPGSFKRLKGMDRKQVERLIQEWKVISHNTPAPPLPEDSVAYDGHN